MEDTYGFPYFLIHRGDLHRILLDKALSIGVVIKTSSYVTETDEAVPSVTLASGQKYTADVIIGADGKYLAGNNSKDVTANTVV
jgi:salicylate hydroxylase